MNIKIPEMVLATEVFDKIGTGVVSAKAEIMALAVLTAQETEVRVAYNGADAVENVAEIDAIAADYVTAVADCCTKDEVIDYFNKIDDILTDADGRYYTEWLTVVAAQACKALVAHLDDVDALPADLAAAVGAYVKTE